MRFDSKSKVGKRFDRIVITDILEDKGCLSRYMCVCDCGTRFARLWENIKSAGYKSCGCYNRQNLKNFAFKHGGTGSPEFMAWTNMKGRCERAKNYNYAQYGGRGIMVCEEWKDFSKFLSDMGKRPSPNHSLDRIDNNGNYEKANCRWATTAEQARNKSNTVTFEVDGVRLCLMDMAKRHGLRQGTVRARLARGWSIDEAFKTPSGVKR